jgi:thiamine pyrophosphokinase
VEDGSPALSSRFATSGRKYLMKNAHTKAGPSLESNHFIEKKLSLDIVFKRFNILPTRNLNDIQSRAYREKNRNSP